MLEHNNPDQRTLVIDSSYGSTVAIVGGSALTQTDTRAHVEQLVPHIQTVLKNNHVELQDLNNIVVGIGPAPFTGLRAGIVAARALAFAQHVPLLGQDILEPQALWLAQQLNRMRSGKQEHTHTVRDIALIANDARRKQLYWRAYDITGIPALPDDNHVDYMSQKLPAPVTAIDISKPEDIMPQLLSVLGSQSEESTSSNTTITDALDYRVHVMGQGVQRYRASLIDAYTDIAFGQIYDESLWQIDPQQAALYMTITAYAHYQQGQPCATEPLYVRRPDVAVPNPLKHVLGSGNVHHHE